MDKEIELIPATNVFSGAKYEVPIYQRNFSWELDQIEQMIGDINDIDNDYFLGSLIVDKVDSKYEVIDGQQRLTTLYLLRRYLGMSLGEDVLQFEAREKANRTLAVIGTAKNKLGNEFQSIELVKGFKIMPDLQFKCTT